MKLGKWIGGGLGWALGGPLGALVGFILGSAFDNIQIKTFSGSTRATNQGDFMLSLLVLTAAVMKADGKVVKSELDFVKATFRTQFGEEVTKQYLIMLRDMVNKDQIPLRDVCIQIKSSMDYSSRLELIHFLFRISAADNQIHASEINLIQKIANDCGIAHTDFESLKAMFVKQVDSAYKILEIDVSASDEEIKKAYKKMAVKYHPDKVSHLGSDIQKAANEKFQQLNAAYEAIKKQRGIV